MIRIFGLGRTGRTLAGGTLAVGTFFSVAAMAATPERVRGTVQSISATELVVHTAAGSDVTIGLGENTHYLKVLKADLGKVEKDSYIGTATKEVGGKLIALEVVIFPPAMRGTGDGHYAWDKIPDTTLAGKSAASSTMTNGSVSAVTTTGAVANSTMTNGNVSAASAKGGAKQLTVTYKGGEQMILVPPTAPIVTFQPGAMSDVVAGKTVFVNASNNDGKLTANAVAVGTDGANPPM
jgi:hypothetical protein